MPTRHAGERRYPRLSLRHKDKSWIPAFAGMTRWMSPERRSFRRLASDHREAGVAGRRLLAEELLERGVVDRGVVAEHRNVEHGVDELQPVKVALAHRSTI